MKSNEGEMVGWDDKSCEPFNCRQFYYNRAIRILPTYYLCVLFTIPLVFAGYHSFVFPSNFTRSLLISLIPVQTLLTSSFGFGLIHPAWFISTLLVFYLFFPWWLTRAQRKSNGQLVRNIAFWYWIQLLLIVGINYVLMPWRDR